MTSKLEFAVQMTCESCVRTVENTLKDINGISNFDINLNSCTVTVDTTLPIQEVQNILGSTGRKAILKGSAGTLAGVSVIECGLPNIQGVIRFMQIDDDTCIVDGIVDGLKSNELIVTVHENGDLSKGCESVGNVYQSENTDNQHSSILGDFTPNSEGRLAFRRANNINLSDIIGRSLVISEKTSGTKLACGIIARSSGLFENPKTICACDGVSIWDEKKKL